MNWADQLLDALNYLHTQNPPIIYRHIKPQNVKLTSSGKIKLLASGIDGSSETKIDTFVPQTFDTANLHYLPLEQIWERLDAASRNVILNSYDEKSERILKQPADAGSDISIDIMEGKSDPLPASNQINPAIPPEISDILLKALEIRRENRFDSAVIMRQVLRTAFVRIKEREAETANKQNVQLLEVKPEQKMPEQNDAPVEQDKLKAEAEQERQIELIKQQLREAEAQRLLAEQRAAEAEKRLLEKETIDLDEKEFLLEKETLDLSETQSLTLPKFQEDTIPAMFPVTIPPDVPESEVIQKNSSDEYGDLFSSVHKESKSKWRTSAVALVLVAFGGAVFGIWFVMTSKSAESNQTTPSQANSISTSNTAAPEPTIEAVPVPTAEITPEISVMPTPSLPPDSPDFTETPVKQPLPKNKSLSTPPRAKKQTLPAAKKPAAQKKTVTVDDLINDN
jgi:serine/threonine protein kinase